MLIKLAAVLLLVFSPFQVLASGYDEETTSEQQTTDSNQGKQISAAMGEAQQCLSQGDEITKSLLNGDQLKGRAQKVFTSWASLGWKPQAFEIMRRGSPAWLVTAKSPKGFKYAFFRAYQ